MSDLFNQVANFGAGIFTRSVYETAWVALIPDSKDNSKPAFKKSLEWLRRNQLPDGSWSTEYTNNSYDKIVSTLSAIVCLKKWNQNSDQVLVESGLKAFKQLTHKMDDSTHKTLAFELIVTNLVDMVSKYGVDLSNHIIEGIRQQKNKSFPKYIVAKSVHNGKYEKDPMWFAYLECLSGLFDRKEMLSLVKSNGIIGSSFSATSFALITEPKLSKSYEAIKCFVDENNGGIPASPPQPVFALTWSLGFLIIAGIDIKGQEYQKYLDKLEKLWIKSKGVLGRGYSTEAEVDVSAMALFVLNRTGRQINVENGRKLIEMSIGDRFLVYPFETTVSLTTKLHILLALNTYKQMDDKINLKFNETLDYIRGQFHESKSLLANLLPWWISTPFYSLMIGVMALKSVDQKLSDICIQKLIDLQQSDSGWGYQTKSSLEETAYAVLGLSIWLRNNENEDSNNIMDSLKRGKNFMESTEDKTIYPFFISKTMYGMKDVSQTLIYCAQNTSI